MQYTMIKQGSHEYIQLLDNFLNNFCLELSVLCIRKISGVYIHHQQQTPVLQMFLKSAVAFRIDYN